MGRRKFEDVFEECLSALLEGRRSIEESLSLYPSLADRLRPLLESVGEIAASFTAGPGTDQLQRGRQRFLAAAAARSAPQPAPIAKAARPWWRWAGVGAGAAAGLAILALVSATVMDGGGGGRLSVEVITSTPRPLASLATPLQEAQKQLGALRSAVEQERPVEPQVIQEVRATSREIAARLNNPSGLRVSDRVAVATVASRQRELLSRAKGLVCGVQAEEVEETLEAVDEVLGKLGATPEPPGSPTPQGSPSPSPSAGVAQTPAASPTAGSATPQACPGASPTAESSPTFQASPSPAAPASTPRP